MTRRRKYLRRQGIEYAFWRSARCQEERSDPRRTSTTPRLQFHSGFQAVTHCVELANSFSVQAQRFCNEHNIEMSQSKYVQKKIERFLMLNCKQRATHKNWTTVILKKWVISQNTDRVIYLEICTRPDIGFVGRTLSQFFTTTTSC